MLPTKSVKYRHNRRIRRMKHYKQIRCLCSGPEIGESAIYFLVCHFLLNNRKTKNMSNVRKPIRHTTFDEARQRANTVRRWGRKLKPREVATLLAYAEAAQDALLNLKSLLLSWGMSPFELASEPHPDYAPSPQSSCHKSPNNPES